MTPVTHYLVSLNLDPQAQTLGAEVTLTVHPQTAVKELLFLLHRDLEVTSLTAPGVMSCQRCDGLLAFPFTPEAATWQVRFREPLVAGQEVTLLWSYQGHLPQPLCQPWEVNRLTPEWVELGLYAPWFPWNPNDGAFTFTLDVHIPAEYGMAGMGALKHLATGHWRFQTTVPMNDMTIIAAPSLQQAGDRVGNATLRVRHVSGNDDAAIRAVLNDGLWVLKFYEDWFADPEEKQIDVAIAPRECGGGYARPGLIVLSELAEYPADRLLAYIAHEFAHLWWTGAEVSTWEDWLNESFAEFAAVQAVGRRLGEAKRAATLERMRARLPGLPAIRGIDRQSEQAHGALYTKGAVLLADLEERIGVEKMTRLLRQRLLRRVNDTASFLLLLAEIAGSDTAALFDNWLSG